MGVMVKLLRYCGVIVACLLLSAEAWAADPLQQLVKPKPVAKTLLHSSMFQGRGDGVQVCPVTGEKITNKKLKADYFGRTVYFCCQGCLKAAQREPGRFIKPTMAEQQEAVKAYLAKVSEAPDGAEFCNE